MDAALASVGFELSESEPALTYLGIQVEGGDEEAQAGGRPTSGRVVAVDPEGPAARAAEKVGDEIVGWSPARSRPPRLGRAVTTPYRFGLTCIASGGEVAELDVERNSPQLIARDVRSAYRAGRGELEQFLDYQPRSPASQR